MNTEYSFHYEHGLSVEIKQADSEFSTIYMDDEALNLFKAIDTKKYDHLRVGMDKIEIQNGEVLITIHDIENINKAGLLKYLPQLFPKIKHLIVKAKRKENKNKHVHKTSFNNKKVKASAIVISILSYSIASMLNFSNEKDIKPLYSIENQENEDTLTNGIADLNLDDFTIKTDEKPQDFTPITNIIDQNKSQSEIDYQSYLEQIKAPINDKIAATDGNNYVYPVPEAQEITIEQGINPEITFLNYEPLQEAENLQYVKENYHDLILEASKKWGISPNIPEAILTQESGGREKNLMQIIFSVWDNEPLTVHNFETGKDETFILTSNNAAVSTRDVTYITPKDLENPKTNISIGIILIRKSAEYMNFHIGATIQCYNMGIGNMHKILSTAAKNQGKSIEDILSNQKDLSFTKYTNIINAGDPKYLEHVMRYMENTNGCYIDYLNESGELLTESIMILPEGEKDTYFSKNETFKEEVRNGLGK